MLRQKRLLSYRPPILGKSGKYSDEIPFSEIYVPIEVLHRNSYFQEHKSCCLERIKRWWSEQFRPHLIESSQMESPSSSRHSVTDDIALTLSQVVRKVQDVNETKKQRYVLIVGEAGSGKTSISYQLARTALNPRLDLNPDRSDGIGCCVEITDELLADQDFEFVFRYPCGNASGRDAKMTLEDFLFTSACLAQIVDSSLKHKFFEYLIRTGARTLLILDGLDEFPFFKELLRANTNSNLHAKMPLSELLKNLMLGKLLSNCLVVVTSRPARANQLCGKFQEKAEVFLVQPLSDQQKYEICRRLMPDVGHKLAGFAQQMDIVWNFMTTPFICQMVCSVFEKNDSCEGDDDADSSESTELRTPRRATFADLSKTLTENGGITDLYQNFLLLYINCGHVIAENLLSRSQRQELVKKLAECAGKCLIKKSLTFSESSLRDVESESHSKSAFVGEIFPCVLRMGYNDVGDPECYFVHFTFLEFFAAIWLWVFKPKVCPRVRDILSDPSSNVLLFYFGLKSSRATEFWETFFDRPYATNDDKRYLYAVSVLDQNWDVKNLNDCSGIMQAVCDGGDNSLLRKFANFLPEVLEIDTKSTSARLYFPLGNLAKHKDIKLSSVKLRLRRQHVTALGPLLRSGVNHVDMGENKLTTDDVTTLCSHLDNGEHSVTKLMLYHNPSIGDMAAELLAARCSHLVILDLWKCGFASAGIRQFVAALPRRVTLTQLNLGMNDIGDEGVDYLIDCEALMSKLQSLKLRDCNIGDDGAHRLASIMTRSDIVLERVDVRKNAYTTRGYESLLRVALRVDIKNLKVLQTSLSVTNTQFEDVNARQGLQFDGKNKCWYSCNVVAKGPASSFEITLCGQ